MAQIVMPSIDVNLPVFHGTATETLSKGAGHLYYFVWSSRRHVREVVAAADERRQELEQESAHWQRKTIRDLLN